VKKDIAISNREYLEGKSRPAEEFFKELEEEEKGSSRRKKAWRRDSPPAQHPIESVLNWSANNGYLPDRCENSG
jgi:hypothetical protein